MIGGPGQPDGRRQGRGQGQGIGEVITDLIEAATIAMVDTTAPMIGMLGTTVVTGGAIMVITERDDELPEHIETIDGLEWQGGRMPPADDGHHIIGMTTTMAVVGIEHGGGQEH